MILSACADHLRRQGPSAGPSGKEVIRNINHLARQPEFSQRLVFLDDYDLNVARYLSRERMSGSIIRCVPSRRAERAA